MRIQGRYKAKKWLKPWMFWVVFYPLMLVVNFLLSPWIAYNDVKVILFEWSFNDEN